MRQLDENKRKKIMDAAIKLIVTIGFSDTSMHKIAKEAKVAASTIYLYFENKEDMLNNVYLKVKRDFSDAILKGFDGSLSIKEGFQRIFDNTCYYLESHPLESSFIDQFENSALINKAIREQALVHFNPISILVEKGRKQHILKNTSYINIAIFIYYPIAAMIRGSQREKTSLTKKDKELLFNMVWDAIKA